MTNKIRIGVDAMGGDNSPKKILEGIEISLKKSNDNFFLLFGKKEILEKELVNFSSIKKYCEIIDSPNYISDDESPLTAAKKGKDTCMWMSIDSQKKNIADISLSAGNTGALLVVSRLILNTIAGINKPALAGLWPNNNGMNIVLDLGANIECDEKNLLDFSSMGSALFKSLFVNEVPKVALLNVGHEEHKGKARSVFKCNLSMPLYTLSYTATVFMSIIFNCFFLILTVFS